MGYGTSEVPLTVVIWRWTAGQQRLGKLHDEWHGEVRHEQPIEKKSEKPCLS
jgi:hypothetical protein